MSIPGYDEYSFGKEVAHVVTPAQPVRSVEHLHGRTKELEQINRALFQPGRHIFIHGDRGVGKSSLAATAAIQYQSSDASPIFVGGASDATFNSIIANIVEKSLGVNRLEATKILSKAGVNLRFFDHSTTKETSDVNIQSLEVRVGDAVELLRFLSSRRTGNFIVVVDEFEAIADESERNKFASLIKQIGDQSVDVKFIFSGVGYSLDELLGAHKSAFRQLECIALGKLPWEGRLEIVKQAMQYFGLEILEDVNWRIAMVSDGYPHYVHLIAEKILWEVFVDDEVVDIVRNNHYKKGLDAAVRSIGAELRRSYEKAVLSRPIEYEGVVWSTADTEDLHRPLASMRDSYIRIMSKQDGKKILGSIEYSRYIRNLKAAEYGGILTSIHKRVGWYKYTESMLRGYVKMQAEANGVSLDGSMPNRKPTMHVVNDRSGSYGPMIPPGVNVNRPIRGEEDIEN